MRKASRWLWAALIVLGICHSVAAQQRRWAALDANGEGSAPVMWGATEEEARQRAVEACKKVSKTCADGPASTHDLNEVFAIVCCTEPRRGCAASAAANRREAVKNVQEMFADAGYKDSRSSTICRQQPARGSRRVGGYSCLPAKKASPRCQLKVQWAASP